MAKKSSLGHNPLAYSLRNHASFDFIRDTTQDQVKSRPDSAGKKPAKKVVSYYLDEQLVERIKEIADHKEESYSQIAGDMLKDSVERYDQKSE